LAEEEREFAAIGIDDAWVREHGPRVRLGVANVYRKMSALGLWEFVRREHDSDLGNLHFRCVSVPGLIARLAELGFTRARPGSGFWQSRERVTRLSLHIKHFEGWPDDKLQAHIDPSGIGGPWAWLRHAVDAKGYRDVERIARMLAEP